MVLSAGIILVVGGLCACAPLFKRFSQSLGRALSVLGFLVGIVVLIVAIDYALGLNFLSGAISDALAATSSPYLKYFLLAMILLGILLISRPIRNVRWASIISLALGLLIAYFLRTLLPSLFTSSTVLIIVFLIATLAIYTLLRFVEDLFDFIGSVLAFPPIAIAIGLVNIYFGILFFSV
ncbi:MAG: hypothetical protein AUI50_01230 [Crenarchaeota archaeon 13_1_40CM_2_52_14]|nr:MAG: hypothetical protein AUI97_00650 [Crenarchaeota archaeon 13_1_40CM_3_52_17]OLD35659.1 MAG: hypothetical protein AUI50_01230 [Crenarchaeota archaeon 13_1_40CM_2_52_14]